MKKNKMGANGFSLVELLAVIVILGILSVAAVVGTSRILGRAKEEEMDTQRQNLLMAAKSYAQANPKVLPVNIGESREIEATVIGDSKYLKNKLVDSQGKSCMASVVQIYKYDKAGYTYTAYIRCENGIYEEAEVRTPVITPQELNSFLIEDGSAAGEDIGLASYNYVIVGHYQESATAVELYRSESILLEGQKSFTFSVDLNLYSREDKIATFEIFVQAYNRQGGSSTNNKSISWETIFCSPSIHLSTNSISIEENASETVMATLNCTDSSVTWTSTNPSVATVHDGVITGVGVGTTTVVASLVDGTTSTIDVSILSSCHSPVSFSTDSWNTIVCNSQMDNIDAYHVGDTKEVDLGSLGVHTLRIANLTKVKNCSIGGYSQSACGFVLEFADVITTRAMHTSATNVGTWPITTMRTYVNTTVYNALPEVLRNAIIDTMVITGHSKSSGDGDFDNINTVELDKLYLPSMVEVYGANYSYDTVKTNQTRQLDYYSTQGVTTSSYSATIKKNGTTATAWFLRAASSNNATNFTAVTTAGNRTNVSATTVYGVSPAFRIATLDYQTVSAFETDSWETIVSNVQSGNTSAYNIGDTKKVNMGSLGVHTLRVANKSTPSACSGSGYSQTACGFVLEFVDIISGYPFNSNGSTVGGWPASEIRTYLNTDVYNSLPSDLRNGIINTTVLSGYEKGKSSNYTSTDKLYLISFVEVYKNSAVNDTLKNTKTRQLDFYSSISVTDSSENTYWGAIKTYNNEYATYWWLRSPYNIENDSDWCPAIDGRPVVLGIGNYALGVSPAFRLG